MTTINPVPLYILSSIRMLERGQDHLYPRITMLVKLKIIHFENFEFSEVGLARSRSLALLLIHRMHKKLRNVLV
jgi:hypothetical protein